MRRLSARPRPGWQSKVEAAGLSWHTPGQAYWNESAIYAFRAREIDVIEAATNELAGMCLAAAQYVIDQSAYRQLGIVETAIPLIESSWEAEPPSLYGRFDLAYAVKDFDGKFPVIGSWVIGHEPRGMAAGIGIRESDIPITTNFSQFVPHLFE